nr:LysM peptidoglycan-binding domain-containing protein [Ardenticatena sp.]
MREWLWLLVGVLMLGVLGLAWQRYRQGSRWKRKASLYVDLIAVAITAFLVTTVVLSQQSERVEATPTPTLAPRKAVIILTPTPTLMPTATRQPTATPLLPTETPSPPPTPTPVVYTVQQGDTLADIAARFGVTVEALRAANNLSSDTLQVNQALTIPLTPTPTPEQSPVAETATPEATPTPVPPTATPATRTYVVQPGDTLYLIAQRFGVSMDAIIQRNPNINPDNLQVGQELIIP